MPGAAFWVGSADRSRPRARRAPCADPRRGPNGRPPIAQPDGGIAPGCRCRADRAASAASAGIPSRSTARHRRAAPRAVRRRRPAGTGVSHPGAPRAAARRARRRGRACVRHPDGRSPRPAASVSAHAPTRATRGDCRSSRRPYARPPGRPTDQRRRREEERARLPVDQPLDTHLRQSGQPAPGSRAAKTSATGSATSRRATNESTWDDASIEPLGVVDQADERSLLSRLRQEPQYGECEEKAVWWLPLGERERRAERGALWSRQSVEAIQQRRAQLMQSGERELHLRLNGRRPDHMTPCCSVPHVLEERRLADARLPCHDERAALATPERVERSIQRPALLRTSDQRRTWIVRRVPTAGCEQVAWNDSVVRAADKIGRPRDRDRPRRGADWGSRGMVHGSATITSEATPRARETPGPAPRCPGVAPGAQ